MTTEQTTMRNPVRNRSDGIPRKEPESRPRSHHSEQATYRKVAMTLPEMEPIPPMTTMSRIS